MAMYAGKVKNDGNWDDNTSLGALLEEKFSALSFKKPESDADKEYNKKIAFQAQAEAIIKHIVDNMEINGITTKGDVTIDVKGDTDPEVVGGHEHPIDISSTKEDVVFTQNNDGTGHVE